MNLRDTPAQAAFRTRLRSWLASNLPTDAEPVAMRDRFQYMRDWQRRLAAGGWTALSWPKEYGGQGLGQMEEAILNQELSRSAAPATLPLMHLGRPFLTHGTEEQKQKYLPDLLSSDVIWCQGFSEPGAGSDLASLRTKATVDGDDFVLSGQKVWTSLGVFADMCLVLARTDDAEPKHRGISAFVVPLDAPGVTVRPIIMANGDEEFAEIFLSEVRVPLANMLGTAGSGWAIAMSTISYERGASDIGYQAKFERFYLELLAGASHSGGLDDPTLKAQIGRAGVLIEVFRMHCLRRLSERESASSPGPMSSVDKLLMTKVEQTLLQVALDGAHDLLSKEFATWFDRYLYGRAGSIYGGTAQIQKNIIAQRMLGLGHPGGSTSKRST